MIQDFKELLTLLGPTGIIMPIVMVVLIWARYALIRHWECRPFLAELRMPSSIDGLARGFMNLGLAIRRLTTSWSAQEGMMREVEVALSDSPIRTREARDAEAIANAQEDRAAGTRTWLERRQEIEDRRARLLKALRFYQNIERYTPSPRQLEWANLKILETLLQIRNLPNDTITATSTGPPPEFQGTNEGNLMYLYHDGILSRIRPEEDPPKEEPRPSRMIRAKDQSDFLVDKEDGVDDA